MVRIFYGGRLLSREVILLLVTETLDYNNPVHLKTLSCFLSDGITKFIYIVYIFSYVMYDTCILLYYYSYDI